MPFNSFSFWVIFPLIFILYWLIPSRYDTARKIYLIAVSYLLYMNWNPYFALVLLYITLTTFYGALTIARYGRKRRQTLAALLSVIVLAPLLMFKYYNFINNNIAAGLEAIDLHFVLPGLNWAIPVGISFFTFQALGYMLDVYRGKELPEKSFIDYMLFCSFFPQTASGPISRADELLPQIKEKNRRFEFSDGVAGLKLVLWGIFLKCVVADRVGLYVDTVFDNYSHFSGINCMWAAILYSIQIYGDFAGYSLMAIGIARTLGFRLINNFNRPYLADSVTAFWRRWHISLTRWLTEHIYIPLGGSRCTRSRHYTNILVTFAISGLWHGANWTFIVWGTMHGIAQIGEKASGMDPKGHLYRRKWFRNAKVLRIIITFAIVTLAWIIFRMPTITDAVAFIGRIFTDNTPQEFMYKATNTDKFLTFFAILLLMAAELRAEFLREHTAWLDTRMARWTIYVSLFCIILAMGVLDAGSFIYVNF